MLRAVESRYVQCPVRALRDVKSGLVPIRALRSVACCQVQFCRVPVRALGIVKFSDVTSCAPIRALRGVKYSSVPIRALGY